MDREDLIATCSIAPQPCSLRPAIFLTGLLLPLLQTGVPAEALWPGRTCGGGGDRRATDECRLGSLHARGDANDCPCLRIGCAFQLHFCLRLTAMPRQQHSVTLVITAYGSSALMEWVQVAVMQGCGLDGPQHDKSLLCHAAAVLHGAFQVCFFSLPLHLHHLPQPWVEERGSDSEHLTSA